MSRTETAFCGCCCPDGKHCFQAWTAVWSCETLSWTGPTAGAKACRTATSTAWAKTGSTATTCTYTIYVQMEKCCTADGDCTGEANTATPALPFGGNPPDDCPCNPCIDTCGCFTVGSTAGVAFAGVLNGMACIECPLGAGSSAFYRGGTGTLGTYTFNRTGLCSFGVTITGLSYQFATGPTDGGCPADGAFEDVPLTLTGDLTFDGVGTWTLHVFQEDAQIFFGTAAQGDCDGPLIFTNDYTAYDPCGATTFALMIDGTATVVFTPCVPP